METQEILQGIHDWTNGKIVYDISVAHPDGQGNPTKYATLAAALGANGANIPEAMRKGGMSVKFVHSSDNKYVQFRYKLQYGGNTTAENTKFTNPDNWQGVDVTPIAGSHNLVESGGVYDSIEGVTNSYDTISKNLRSPNAYINSSGQTSGAGTVSYVDSWDVTSLRGQTIYVKCTGTQYNNCAFYTSAYNEYFSSTNVIGEVYQPNSNYMALVVPSTAKSFAMSSNNAGDCTVAKKIDRLAIIEDNIDAIDAEIDSLQSNVKSNTEAIGEAIQYLTETDLKKESGAIDYRNGSEIVNSTFFRTDWLPVTPQERQITVIMPCNFTANDYKPGLAFYDENKRFITGYRETTSYNTWMVKLAVYNIPSNAAYFRTCMMSSYTYTWRVNVGNNTTLVPKVAEIGGELTQVQTVLNADATLYNNNVNVPTNVCITDDGTSYTTSGGTYLVRVNVSSLQGKHIRIVNTSRNTFLKYAFYNAYNLNPLNDISESNLVEVGTKNVFIDEIVTIPEGALSLFVVYRSKQDPDASCFVYLKKTKLDDVPQVNGTGYPQLPDYTRPLSYATTEIENISPLMQNGEILYGGANTLYSKKLATLGDSLLNAGNSACQGWLSMIASLYVRSFNGGGSQTRPAPYQFIANSWNSGQDRAIRLVESNYNPDFIIYENVNDRPADGVGPENMGTLADKPWMLSQYIEPDDVFENAAAARSAWDNDMATILSGAAVKKGTIVRLKYGTTAYKVTLTGTASVDGTIIISIGGTQYPTHVSNGDTADEIANNIIQWQFSGYTASNNNGVITFTSTGSADTITVAGAPSGISTTVVNASSYYYIFEYFIGWSTNDFADPTKWTETRPTLYACYKGLIEYLLTNLPTTRIIMLGCTSPFASRSPSGKAYTFEDGSWDIYKYRNDVNTTAWYDEKLREMQKNVAELYGIMFIDLDKSCNINLINFLTYYPENNVHPYINALERWAEVIYSKLPR